MHHATAGDDVRLQLLQQLRQAGHRRRLARGRYPRDGKEPHQPGPTALGGGFGAVGLKGPEACAGVFVVDGQGGAGRLAGLFLLELTATLNVAGIDGDGLIVVTDFQLLTGGVLDPQDGAARRGLQTEQAITRLLHHPTAPIHHLGRRRDH